MSSIKAAYLALFQTGLIFKPKGDGTGDVSPPGILSIVRGLEGRLSLHRIKTSDKREIVVEYEAPLSENHPLIIMFHGNKGHWKDVGAPKEGEKAFERTYRLDLLKDAVHKGAGAMAVSLRGYGLSTGAPSEKGFGKDVDAVLDFVRDKAGMPARRIIVLGESLGAAMALKAANKLAERNSPAAIAVMIAAFSSMADRAHDEHPDMPLSWLRFLLRHPLDNMQALSSFPKRTKLYIAHPAEDEVTKIEHGRKLAARAKELGLDVTFREIPGGHVTWPAQQVVGDVLALYEGLQRAQAEKDAGFKDLPVRGLEKPVEKP